MQPSSRMTAAVMGAHRHRSIPITCEFGNAGVPPSAARAACRDIHATCLWNRSAICRMSQSLHLSVGCILIALSLLGWSEERKADTDGASSLAAKRHAVLMGGFARRRLDLANDQQNEIPEEHWLSYVYGTAMLLLISASVFLIGQGLSNLKELRAPRDNTGREIAQMELADEIGSGQVGSHFCREELCGIL